MTTTDTKKPKKRRFKMPEKRLHRQILGWALIFGGIFGFAPIAGFWMLPLGLVVLSVDSPRIRRKRRKLTVWWGRRKQSNNAPSFQAASS